MFFLNEHLIAAFLTILAFIISFTASLFFKISILSALLRSTVIAFIFMFAGLLLGKVMKNLVVEAFLSAEKEKDETKEQKGEGEEDEDKDKDQESNAV